jgi:hypothetical protein
MAMASIDLAQYSWLSHGLPFLNSFNRLLSLFRGEANCPRVGFSWRWIA